MVNRTGKESPLTITLMQDAVKGIPFRHLITKKSYGVIQVGTSSVEVMELGRDGGYALTPPNFMHYDDFYKLQQVPVKSLSDVEKADFKDYLVHLKVRERNSERMSGLKIRNLLG